MKKIASIGLIANMRKSGVKEVVDSCIQLARQQGIRCLAEEKLKGICPEADKFLPPQELARLADVVFTFGGDGTILFAARFTGPSGTPLLGVNLGSLGFLTQIGPEQLKEAFSRTVAGDYRLDRRMAIEISCKDQTYFALNEVVVDKGSSPRVITIELGAGEESVGRYTADGLIIATPTGSTAHSLAAGGPIIDPRMQVLLAMPMFPHSLTVRPLVFPEQTLLTVKVSTEGLEARVVVDGQMACQVQSEEEILVKKAPHTVDLIDLGEHSFYDLLKSRFKWAG